MSYLKTVAHSAKIYVRPLQRYLSIEVENTVEEVSIIILIMFIMIMQL